MDKIIFRKININLKTFFLLKIRINKNKCQSKPRRILAISGSTDYTSHIDIWGVGCILYEMFIFLINKYKLIEILSIFI
jgi:serine/threonine protein kinase